MKGGCCLRDSECVCVYTLYYRHLNVIPFSPQYVYNSEKKTYNFQRRMSRLPQRWRTQRNAIRNANCKTSWIIKILNAHCASGTFPVACLPECLRTPLRVVFLNTWCFDCISRQRDLCGVDVVSDSVYRVSLWRKRKRGKRTKWKRKIKFVTQTTVPRRSVVGRWTLYFRNPAVCFRVIFSHACLRTPLCVCVCLCVCFILCGFEWRVGIVLLWY